MTVAPSDQQIGFAEESTYGTRVAATRFYAMETPKFNYSPERLESQATIAGLDIVGSDQWNGGPITVGADLAFELPQDYVGLLLKHMFGGLSTSSTTHTFTPGDLDSLSLTTQMGVAFVEGAAVTPVELLGCKIAEWEIGCQADEIATLGLTVAARDMHAGTRAVSDGVLNETTTLTSATAAFTQSDKGKLIAATGIPSGTTIASVTNATTVVLSAAATATATSVAVTIGATLASASYNAAGIKPFKFNHATVSVGGSSVDVMDLSIKGNNGLKTDRRFLGSQLPAKAIRDARRSYTVELGSELRSLNAINALKNGSEVAVVSTFTGSASSLTITMNCRYDAVDWTTSGQALSEEKVTLKAIRSSTTTGSAITAVLVSASGTI